MSNGLQEGPPVTSRMSYITHVPVPVFSLALHKPETKSHEAILQDGAGCPQALGTHLAAPSQTHNARALRPLHGLPLFSFDLILFAGSKSLYRIIRSGSGYSD